MDATCSDVKQTHQVIRASLQEGYCIVYIGTKNHPEPEGALGHAPPDRISLVTSVDDVNHLSWSTHQAVAVITQTTLSQWDTADMVQAILRRYPGAVIYNEICLATQLRQRALSDASRRVDAVVVVGDVRSNNTAKLVEVAVKQGRVPAFRIDNAAQLDRIPLHQFKSVALSAGSSTPSGVTREVLRQLRSFTKPDPKHAP